MKHIIQISLGLLVLVFISPHPANAIMYNPGQTLEPQCSPIEADCGVIAPVATVDTMTDGAMLFASSGSWALLPLGTNNQVLKIFGGGLTWTDDETIFSASEQGLHLDAGTGVFSISLDGTSLANSASGLKISSTYAGQTSIDTLGTITTGHWHGDTIDVTYGGTGLTEVPDNGELIVGNGTGFSLSNLVGADGVYITNATGTVTVGLSTANTPIVSTVTGDDYLPIYPVNANYARRKITYNDLFSGVLGSLSYQGTWNSNTNLPVIVDSDCTTTAKGKFYIVNTGGTTQLGNELHWEIGDWLICNGTIWEEVENTNAIASIFGRTGAITAQSGDYTAAQITNVAANGIAAVTVQGALNELDVEKEHVILPGTTAQYLRGDKTWQTLNSSAVSETSNLYYTDARARLALNSTITGISYSTSTGIFSLTSGYNIPTNNSTTNWNTAYNWGNHAGAGYLTSVDYSQLVNGAGKYLDYRPNNVACTNNQVMKYNVVNSRWECGSDLNTIYTAAGNGLTLVGSTFGLVLSGTTLDNSVSGLKISDTYTGQTSINTLGTITTGHWGGDTIDIAAGGTGVNTVPNNGELLIGNGNGYSLSNLSGTDGIVITNATGTITISNTLTSVNEVTNFDNEDYIPIYTAGTETRQKITYENLFAGVLGSLSYQGTWNSASNTPTLIDANCTTTAKGEFYIVNVGGTTQLGNELHWEPGDWLICNGTIWEEVETTNAIASIFGRTGAVTAQSGDYTATQIISSSTANIAATTVQGAISELDTEKQANIIAGTTSEYYRGDKTWQTLNTAAIAEMTNLYYTDARARSALSTNATGLSYSTSTGILSLADGYNLPLTASTTNWNEAYDWGNHGSVGYLTSVDFSQIVNGANKYLDYRPNNVACSNNQLIKYNAVSSRWECGSDLNTTYTASENGLTIIGSTFDLVLDGSTLAKSASGLKIANGYIGQTSINTLGTITTGHWHGDPIDTLSGGTGATTTPQNGELLIGNGTGYSLATMAGVDGVYVSSTAGAITVGLSTANTPIVTTFASDDYLPIYPVNANFARRKITYNDLFSSVLGSLSYQGTWNANSNSPTIVDGNCVVGTKGKFYIVDTTGTTTLGAETSWVMGDWLICNGTAWQKVANVNAIASIFGRTGAVTAQSGDYTAAQITNTPAGSIAALTAQGALNELDVEKEHTINPGTSTQYFRGDKTWQTLDKAAIGLSNIENTAISSWTGSTGITTLGTIITGTWHGADIALGTYTSGNYVAGATANAGLTLLGTEAATLGILLNGTSLSVGSSGLAINLGNTNTWSGAQTFSSAIIAPTATDTINGLIINSGALSGIASITGSGALTIASGGTNTNLTLNSNGTGVVNVDSASTGAINLGTNANAKIITIGNGSGATSLVFNAGTGNIDLGANAVARTINIGTGAAVIETINVGGTGANVIALGNTQTAGSVSIGGAMTSGTINIGGTGLQTGAITIGGGTGAQTLNLGTGGTGAKAINIGTGTVTNTLIIGNTSGATQLSLRAGSNGIIMTGVTGQINGNLVLCINASTGKLYFGASNTSCQSSSLRYKHDIANIELGLETINILRPVSFTYNGIEEKTLGFIAEEVAGVDERLINRNADGLPESINPDAFTPILVKALQELNTKVDTLGISISALDEAAGGLEFSSAIELGLDNIGEVVVSAGSGEALVQFEKPYQHQPVVTISKMTQGILSDYYVDEATTNGFKVKIDPVQTKDMIFSWHSFGAKDGVKIFSNIIAAANTPVAEVITPVIDVVEETIIPATEEPIVPITEDPISEEPIIAEVVAPIVEAPISEPIIE